MNRSTAPRALPALIVLAVLLAACIPVLDLARGAPTPTRPGQDASSRPLPPTYTPTPSPATPTPPVALSPGGPWLTYLAAGQGGYEVIAANPDGSGRKVIGAFSDLNMPVLNRPRGSEAHYFSLLNGRDSSLTVFQLPEGKAVRTFPLLSHPDLTADQRSRYAAVLNQETPAAQSWSPDGRLLALTGAMDGAFTDVYVFDPSGGGLTRLSERLGESFYPTWLPNSSGVLVQEIETAPAGGPALVRAVYLVSTDASKFTALYRPNSLSEEIYGWLDGDTFIAASRRQYGLVEARRFSLEKKQHALLQFSGLMERAALDPTAGALAFTVKPPDQDVPSLQAGLYWTSAVSGPVPVAKARWQRLAWSAEAGRFFAASPLGVLSFAPNQERTSFEREESIPAAAPNGKLLAFAGADSSALPGLRIYDPAGKLLRSLDQPVQEVLWMPDSSGLFFLAEGTLYRLNPWEQGDPVAIEDKVSRPGWVGAQ